MRERVNQTDKKCWRPQNIGVDRNYRRRLKSRVDKILALTKILRQQNSRVDKNLASTKFSRRQNVGADADVWLKNNWVKVESGLAYNKGNQAQLIPSIRGNCFCRFEEIFVNLHKTHERRRESLQGDSGSFYSHRSLNRTSFASYVLMGIGRRFKPFGYYGP
jgi:hypothetical protein